MQIGVGVDFYVVEESRKQLTGGEIRHSKYKLFEVMYINTSKVHSI